MAPKPKNPTSAPQTVEEWAARVEQLADAVSAAEQRIHDVQAERQVLAHRVAAGDPGAAARLAELRNAISVADLEREDQLATLDAARAALREAVAAADEVKRREALAEARRHAAARLDAAASVDAAVDALIAGIAAYDETGKALVGALRAAGLRNPDHDLVLRRLRLDARVEAATQARFVPPEMRITSLAAAEGRFLGGLMAPDLPTATR